MTTDPLFDHAQTSVMMRLGWEGWSAEQVKTLFQKLNVKGRDGKPVPDPSYGHVSKGINAKAVGNKMLIPKSCWLIQPGEIASWRATMNGSMSHGVEDDELDHSSELKELQEELQALQESCLEVEAENIKLEKELAEINQHNNTSKTPISKHELSTVKQATYAIVDLLGGLDDAQRAEFWKTLAHHHQVDWVNMVAGMLSAGKVNQINELQSHLKAKFPMGG